jgi:hypothetical protein
MPGYFTTARQCQSVTNIRELQSLLLPIKFAAGRTNVAADSIRCIINATFQLPLYPLLSVNCSADAATLASVAGVHGFSYRRMIWTMAAQILDGAIRLNNLSPAEDMPARSVSMTNMKPTALAVGVPGEVSQADRELEFA